MQLLDFTIMDHFENVRRTFAFQHPKYATVKFDECSRTTILSPEHKLVFTKSILLANLSGSVFLRADLDSVLIEATQCDEHDKQSRTQIHFQNTQENILESTDGFQNNFRIDRRGVEWFCDKFGKSLLWHRADQCPKCSGVPKANKARLFIAKEGYKGLLFACAAYTSKTDFEDAGGRIRIFGEM